MYIPTYVPSVKAAQISNIENVAYTTDTQDTAATYQAPPSPQYSTIQVPESQPQHTVQLLQPQGKFFEEQVIKREPKSLLDSYIPSHLQLQYYRQQQQQNYLQEPVIKVPRKSTYKTITNVPSESNLRYSYQPSPYRYKK